MNVYAIDLDRHYLMELPVAWSVTWTNGDILSRGALQIHETYTESKFKKTLKQNPTICRISVIMPRPKGFLSHVLVQIRYSWHWRYAVISNHQYLLCLSNGLLRWTIKENKRPGFPSQRNSNTESVSMPRRSALIRHEEECRISLKTRQDIVMLCKLPSGSHSHFTHAHAAL